MDKLVYVIYRKATWHYRDVMLDEGFELVPL